MVAVGALVAVALVGGCTGSEPADPDPVPRVVQDPPEATEDPTSIEEPAESGPEKPERPAAMERDDAEGAAAAAVYFLELYEFSMKTGDVSEWERMSFETCDWCAGSIEQAELIAERGDLYEGSGISATVADPDWYLRDEATGIFPLDVEMREAATVIYDIEGTELYSAPRIVKLVRVEAALQNGEWVIVEVAATDQG